MLKILIFYRRSARDGNAPTIRCLGCILVLIKIDTMLFQNEFFFLVGSEVGLDGDGFQGVSI